MSVCFFSFSFTKPVNEIMKYMLGCTSAEFNEHIKQHPDLFRALESHLAGLSCTLELYTGKKAGKCNKIMFEPPNTNIIDVLLRMEDRPLRLDPSLSLLSA